MKFKQIQALKTKAYKAFADHSRLDVPVVDTAQIDSISLAFVGDAYYALYFRSQLIQLGVPLITVLHGLASEIVSAKIQAQVYRRLKDSLTQVEQQVCQRARNAHSMAPKSATVAEYHDSTALEALIGYTVLSKDDKRLAELMALVDTYSREICRTLHVHKEQS